MKLPTKPNLYYFTHVGKSGSPLLIFIGHININPEPFEDLLFGDKICRVGNPPKTGIGSGMACLNRNAEFKPYVTYVGTAYISEFKEKLIFFEIRDEDKPKDLTDKMYAAYIILDHSKERNGFIELKLWDHVNNTVWIARPNFTKYLN